MSIRVFVLVLLNVLSIKVAIASETLFYLVKKADWLAQSTKVSFHPPFFSKEGFISLITPEQVISTAQTLYQGQSDLLLVKLNISAADPRLKWEQVSGSEVSVPHYYGDLSRVLVKKVYPFLPQKDGHFALPKDPFLKRMTSHLLSKGLVSKFLRYQEWQNTDRFHKLQVKNFQRSKVQLQWWYFDFFLEDGSSVVLAFIPQHWWEKPGLASDKKSVFTMALKPKQGTVKRFTTIVPQSDVKSSASHLEIPSHLVIRAIEGSENNQFSIQVNFPEVKGEFTINPTQLPFAAFPSGLMPGPLRTVMSGAPLGSPSFSYVSQIPNSTVTGSLSWDDYQANFTGQAYHEQGRLNDSPERQGGSWTWYHFAGDGWNIFGSPGSYIYLQQGDQIIRSGFQLIGKNYTLTNRMYSSPDHAKLLTGGEISFHHENLTFRLKMDPSTAKTLVCFPSTNPSQVWGTVGGEATLSVSEGSATKTLAGRMFLESCSWEIYKEPKRTRN
ncbi:DUF952 domain-containing protein [Spirosoma arboris]|nr:DUF952 domain-containing protein [Spirosoma arboris]